MGRIAAALTKSIVFPSFSNFWPQDWNASLGAVMQGRQVPVTPDSAFGVMAYYAGVRFLSETLALLPLIVYERLEGGGKDRATGHPMYPILHDVANPEMTSFTWRETAMGHVVGWGNSFSERQLDGRGRTIALWPLRPDRMQVRRGDSVDGRPGPLIYQYRLPQPVGTIVELPASRIFHVRGLAFDGLIGYSPIEIMRRALALGLAVQEYGQRTFDNDARPGVILSHPKSLSTKARENLESSWARNHEGLSNAQRTAVLEEGITVSDIGFPPQDAQFLETRQFTVTEVARGLRLPPHIIGDLSRSTNNNIEHEGLELVKYSLGAWFSRWQQQINKDLIADPKFFAEFLVDAFLAGDALTRAQALWIQRQAGVLNADEWRAIENRNPLPNKDGQVFLQPLNMTTVGEPPVGAEADMVRPSRSVPNPALPDVNVIPDTMPIKPLAPSKNGRDKVPA